MCARLFRSRMILFIFLFAAITAEIDLAAFKLNELVFADRLAGDRAGGVRFDGFTLFLRHLGDEGVRGLVEFVQAAFAADIDVLAEARLLVGVFGAIFFDDRAAADRAQLVGDVLLLAIGDARRDRAGNQHQGEKGNNGFAHNFFVRSFAGLIRLRGSQAWIIPAARRAR